MNAMLQIVAESEFVCAKRLRIFLAMFLVWYYLGAPSGGAGCAFVPCVTPGSQVLGLRIRYQVRLWSNRRA